jgi:hypothetical protein
MSSRASRKAAEAETFFFEADSIDEDPTILRPERSPVPITRKFRLAAMQ